MREAIPDVGYLHRSIEKIAEKVGYHGFMPYTDRVDYVDQRCPANQGWGMVCEKLAGIEVPRRAEYCRVDRRRAQSHLQSLALGSAAWGWTSGAYTPFTHALRGARVHQLISSEELCGARLTFNYMRIGGVAWDLPPDWVPKAVAFLDRFEPLIDEYNALIPTTRFTSSASRTSRYHRRGGDRLQLVGPNLRGSGVKFDVRKDVPYSVYPSSSSTFPSVPARSAPSATASTATWSASAR